MIEEDLQKAYAEMEAILATAANDWKFKRDDYGDAFLELGSRGQFSEIWRKIKKLQRAVWEGQELRGEKPAQIAMEIIPHCMMLVWLIRHEAEDRWDEEVTKHA